MFVILNNSYANRNKLELKSGIKSKMSTSTHFSTTFKTQTHTSSQTMFQTQSLANFKLGFTSNLKQSSKKNTNGLELKSNTNQEELKKGVIWSGWIKYFKLFNSEKPAGFKINSQFFQQNINYPGIDVKEKKDGEYSNIRDKFYFYAVLYTSHLNIYPDKSDFHVVSFFEIDNMVPLIDDKNIHGGLKNLGKFPEGFCFHVQTTSKPLDRLLNKSDDVYKYIICCDTQLQMLSFLKSLKRTKIENQRKKGIVIVPKKEKSQLTQKEIIKSNHNIDFSKADGNDQFHTKSEDDDRWVVINEWSQCSQKCGGGTTTLQRKCILTDRPCKGNAILTKKCNTESCPKYVNNLIKANELRMAPIVIKQPISNKPERYEKCITKEQDILLSKFEKKTGKKYRIPARIIMNTDTLDLYLDADDIKSNIENFKLYETELEKSKVNYECFILKSPSKKLEICPFNLGTEDMNDSELQKIDTTSIPENKIMFYNQWSYDYNLFKYQCKRANREKELKLKLNDNYNKKKDQIKQEIDEERKQLINKKKQEDERLNVIDQLNKNKYITFEALKKEAKLEEMIEAEEKQREELNISRLKKQLQELSNKEKQCRLQIKEKEMASQLNLQAKVDQIRLESAKKEAQNTILKQREELKKKIETMKNRYKRREGEMKREITNLRMKISKEYKNSYKKGNSEKCKAALESKDKKKAYCDANFTVDYSKHTLCLEDFCQTCCDNEFGVVYAMEKQKCIDEVCLQEKEIVESNDSGKWVYLNNDNSNNQVK